MKCSRGRAVWNVSETVLAGLGVETAWRLLTWCARGGCDEVGTAGVAAKQTNRNLEPQSAVLGRPMIVDR